MWMWIGGIIGLVGALIAVWPGRSRRKGAMVRTEADELKEAKYREIRDAELDHASGKLSDEDYAILDAELRKEAVEILDTVGVGAGAGGTATAPRPGRAGLPSDWEGGGAGRGRANGNGHDGNGNRARSERQRQRQRPRRERQRQRHPNGNGNGHHPRQRQRERQRRRRRVRPTAISASGTSTLSTVYTILGVLQVFFAVVLIFLRAPALGQRRGPLRCLRHRWRWQLARRRLDGRAQPRPRHRSSSRSCSP